MRLRTLLCGFVCGAVTMLFTDRVASMNDSDISSDALRQAAKQAATLSESHKKIRKMRAKYDQTAKWWRAPGSPPDELVSRSSTEWVLDGRFMIQKIVGTWLDVPFKGIAILGYDNATEEFMSVWMDTLGTKMLVGRGKSDEAGDVINMQAQYVDMITGETVAARSTIQMPDKKGQTKIEMFRTGPDGEEYKFLEVITARRVRRGA